MNARRSMNGVADPDAAPFERAIVRPLLARLARTSAEASGGTVSSGMAIRKHGGLPDSTDPRAAAPPFRAPPSYRCARTGPGGPHMLRASVGRPQSPPEFP